MQFNPWLLTTLVLSTLAAAPRPCTGEVSTRECIRFGEPTQQSRIVIPASSTQTLVALDFEVTSSSDAIFHVAYINQDSATPSRSRSRYSLAIDGGTAYHLLTPQLFYGRTPKNTDGTIHQRWFLAAIPAGQHTATLGIENTELHDIEISGAWIGVLFLDSSEVGAGQSNTSSQSVGADWTTIGFFTAPTIADRHLIISGYARVSSSVPVEFRLRGDGNVLRTFLLDPENADDGGIFSHIWQGFTSSASIEFQAKGAGATIQAMEVAGQTMKEYSILEGELSGPRSVPNNLQLYPIEESPPIVLNDLSLSGPTPTFPDHHQACGWGFAHTTMSMSSTTESLLWLRLFEGDDEEPLFNDIGTMGHSADSVKKMYRQSSDYGCNVGLFEDVPYRVGQFIQGKCNFGPSIRVEESHFQVVVLPSPDPNDHACVQSSQAPNCPYECTLNPDKLSTVSRTAVPCNGTGPIALVFKDGFESGDTTAWSATAP